METPDKCVAILQRIIELANSGKSVSFEEDWGGNSLTVNVDGGHNHVGLPDCPFDLFVDNLYNSLHGGPGLSWVYSSSDEK